MVAADSAKTLSNKLHDVIIRNRNVKTFDARQAAAIRCAIVRRGLRLFI